MVCLVLAFISVIASQQNAPPPPAAASDQAVELKTPTGTIFGTLTLPQAGAGKVPVALIIAGSGPTDRDGNSAGLPGKNNAYLMLADALAKDGIATVRYDKRGIAASRIAASAEIDLRFENYVDDAAAWIAWLKGDVRFSTVTVIGHSEGSLIGMLAARAARADAYVSLEGPAQNAADVLRLQLKPQLPPALWDASEAMLANLQAGKTGGAAPPALAGLFRPSVQPYLISWFKYTPSAEIVKLTMPVLIVQGGTDIQVGVDEAKALKAAKPDAQLVIVDGMNHVLKHAPADRTANIAAYADPTLPLASEVPMAIAAFIQRH